jgi:phosphoglycerol transferase MdoB-like AlkP superfamily enzyme
MYHSGKNSMPFAMGNQLRDRGYLTLAYHNHTYDYYRRDISHPNLGYEYKGLGNGLDVAKTWPESDLEMMEKTIDEYIDQEPFHAYYMTVSGHLQYNYNGNFIARKNQDLVENLNFSEPARAYLATQIELDRALKYLLERLEQANVDNRTLIVMSADHYPYGLDHEDIENLAGHQVDRNFELYRSSLIIYAPGMEPMTVSEPVSSLDIMPTLSNLLGLDYDSRLFMGRDIFSDQKPQVIFQNRSFITDQGRYNATDNTWEPISGSTTDDEYIIGQLNEIEEKFYYSKKILEEDYYSSLEPD